MGMNFRLLHIWRVQEFEISPHDRFFSTDTVCESVTNMRSGPEVMITTVANFTILTFQISENGRSQNPRPYNISKKPWKNYLRQYLWSLWSIFSTIRCSVPHPTKQPNSSSIYLWDHSATYVLGRPEKIMGFFGKFSPNSGPLFWEHLIQFYGGDDSVRRKTSPEAKGHQPSLLITPITSLFQLLKLSSLANFHHKTTFITR